MKPLKNNFIYGFLAAILLSSFIYFEHFGITVKALNSVFAFLGLFLLLKSPRKALFFIGSFMALFWFYWVGLSFRFTEFVYLVPIVPLGIALLYGIIFLAVYWIENIYYRALVTLVAFNIIEPFGFTWLKFEVLLSQTYFATDKHALALVLLAIILFTQLKKRVFQISLAGLALVFALDFSQKVPKLDLSIKLAELEIDQKTKWLPEYRDRHINYALEHIAQAHKEGYEAVVLPESSFPIYLNHHKKLIQKLKDASQEITIITGALKYENKTAYNSTYIFQKGTLTVADKVFLVPFGESSPLTGAFGRWINETFFGGSEDFKTAQRPTDFHIGEYRFRNAICYEGSVEAMFTNAPQYMIVTSNNGWFAPSIQPSLQRLVMLTWGKKHKVKVLHAANMSPSEIVN